MLSTIYEIQQFPGLRSLGTPFKVFLFPASEFAPSCGGAPAIAGAVSLAALDAAGSVGSAGPPCRHLGVRRIECNGACRSPGIARDSPAAPFRGRPAGQSARAHAGRHTSAGYRARTDDQAAPDVGPLIGGGPAGARENSETIV